MAVNRDNPDLWKEDIAKSVDCYNNWFLQFAPKVYREKRIETTRSVEFVFEITNNLTDISDEVLSKHPEILPILRMATAPPLARDRLIGLAQISSNCVETMETLNRLPPRCSEITLKDDLERISYLITRLLDKDVLTWLEDEKAATELEKFRAATVIADRLCGSLTNPIIRNAQEQRQLNLIGAWLNSKGYTLIKPGDVTGLDELKPATYSFRFNLYVKLHDDSNLKIPVDVVICPKKAKTINDLLLVEAKSAGDYTNVNKRRKEEAQKYSQLKIAFGEDIRYILFLGGYFDAGYLGYEASDGIDWVWEHRIEDLAKFGI